MSSSSHYPEIQGSPITQHFSGYYGYDLRLLELVSPTQNGLLREEDIESGKPQAPVDPTDRDDSHAEPKDINTSPIHTGSPSLPDLTTPIQDEMNSKPRSPMTNRDNDVESKANPTSTSNRFWLTRKGGVLVVIIVIVILAAILGGTLGAKKATSTSSYDFSVTVSPTRVLGPGPVIVSTKMASGGGDTSTSSYDFSVTQSFSLVVGPGPVIVSTSKV